MHPPGFEPGITVPKTVVISISPRVQNFSVRVGGIEPPTLPWQGSILPLNHTRKYSTQYQFLFIKTRKPDNRGLPWCRALSPNLNWNNLPDS